MSQLGRRADVVPLCPNVLPPLAKDRRSGLWFEHGEAISPTRPTARRIAARFLSEERSMSSLNSISVEKLARPDRRATWPRAHRCAALREDFAADPLASFAMAAVRRAHSTVAGWGSEFWRRSRCCDLQGRSGVERGRRGLAAPRWRLLRRSSARRPCSLGESGACTRAGRQAAASRFPGANGVGDALAAKNRPHRLSLAHPPLR